MGLMPDNENIRQSWHIKKGDLPGGSPYGDWVDEGGDYKLSFFYKTEKDPKLRIGIERTRLNGTTNNSYHDVSAANEWTYYEYQFTWPDSTVHMDTFNLHFFTHYATEGKLWIDDVKILKAD